MTLRSRLGVAAAVMLTAVLVAGWLVTQIVRASQIDQLDRQLTAAVPISRVISSEEPPIERRARRIPDGSPLSDVYIARIDDGGRRVIARSQLTEDREPSLPRTSSAFGSELVPMTIGSTDGSGSWRALRMALPDGAEVLIAIPFDRVDATARRTAITVVAAGAAIVLAMGFMGWWLLRLGLRPIAEVTEVADAIFSGDRSRRVREQPRGTEAAQLARAFNLMLDEQAATEMRLRQFVADASHELRTPVSAIGGFADLWRQGALDESELGDAMRRIGRETARMRGLVEDLLLLARLDEGRPLAKEPIDLVQLVRDAALNASATHPSRQIDIDADDAVIVQGDEGRLRQVVDNLVTNALVHGGPESTVKVRVEPRASDVVLSVSDDGPGMSSTEVDHAFDRFWRADAARARAGTGLGLPIVRSVVQAHGGTVSLRSARGQGTTVLVVFPSTSRPTGNPQTTPRVVRA